MGYAANWFHWPPDIFMRSTPHEFWAAYEVYRDMNRPREEADGG